MNASNRVLFCENLGQWDEQVLFRAELNGATAWFTSDGVYYQFTKVHYNENPYGLPDSIASVSADHNMPGPLGRTVDSCEVLMIKADFVRLSSQVEVSANKKVDYYCNFFVGDSSRWRPRVANYEEITYADIYPGIDIKYYGNGYDLEYDIVVHEGADLSQVEIAYEGIESLSIDPSTRVTVTTEWGEFSQHLPHSYERLSGQRMQVSVGIEQTSDYSYRFVGALEHNSDALIIDPVLEFSKLVGGVGFDLSNSLIVDDCGDMLIGGQTSSADFPLVAGFDTVPSAYLRGFVSKFDVDRDELLFSTYLGDSSFMVTSLVASGCDTIVIAGIATRYWQSFVDILSGTGDSLKYARKINGTGDAEYWRTSMDYDGKRYVALTGQSWGGMPIVNAYQPQVAGFNDAFLLKLDIIEDEIVFSTYIGGGYLEQAGGVSIDRRSGDILVCGQTGSGNFPATDYITNERVPGWTTWDQYGLDIFVGRFDSLGNVKFLTILGCKTGVEIEQAIIGGDNESTVFGGLIFSSDFPFAESISGENVLPLYLFLASLNASGDSLDYCITLNSGIPYGSIHDIDTIGNSDTLLVSGRAYSGLATRYSLMPFSNGVCDAFISAVVPKEKKMIFSTYLGGSDFDLAIGAERLEDGRILVGGHTYSSDFIGLEDGVSNMGGPDIFYSVISPCCAGVADFDNDNWITIADLTHLLDYLFFGGETMYCYEEGDMDGDGEVTLADFLYLVDFMFRSGPQPASCLW